MNLHTAGRPTVPGSSLPPRTPPVLSLTWRVTLVLLSTLAVLTACAPPTVTVRRTETHMGTLVHITAAARGPAEAETAIQAAFREIARIDALLSHYQEDSEVSRLNREKELNGPSADLVVNLLKSIEYGRLSQGAFDITVQPILELYDHSFGELGRPPTEDEIGQTLQSVDYRRITVEPDRVAIGDGQKITLGGIAKGYAVDRALEELEARGIRRAIVDAGGDLRTLGRNGERDWTVALRNPRDGEEYITRIRASDRAVVTSGDYERYYDPDRRFHHIVDPRTGYSATELISVTVVADSRATSEGRDELPATRADAVSTAVFVLGRDEGMRLIESLDGVEGLLITRDREILRSSGWAAVEQ